MKRILFFCFLIVPLIVSAQNSRDLLISEIKGSVQRQSGKEKVEMKRGEHILAQDILIIGESTTMILLEPRYCNRYTIKGPYTGTLHNYIQRNEQSCMKNVTRKYMNYLISQALRGHKRYNDPEDDHATVFRKGDSMFDSITVSMKSIDSLYHTIDSLSVLPLDTIVPSPIDSIK